MYLWVCMSVNTGRYVSSTIDEYMGSNRSNINII